MRKEIIKTENYLLVVSDEEPKDVIYTRHSINISKYRNSFYYHNNEEVLGKIIAHRPLNNVPFLEGVDVLPEIEDELDKLYKEKKYSHPDWVKVEEGFNKAREIYKYTEEDILDALEIGYQSGLGYDDDNPNTSLAHIIHLKDSYIQSLNQPKFPVAFEFEIFNSDEIKSLNNDWSKLNNPKTITNSEGRIEWVGEYIFN